MDGDKRIPALENRIRYHQDKYYNDTPEISDQEFDLLWDELTRLDPDNPLFSVVGLDESSRYQKRPHIIFMHSQDKVASEAEFLSWSNSRELSVFIIQHKLDGMSLELQYHAGRLQYGISRGDGKIGDDLSHSVRKIPGIPHRLGEAFSGGVRGEVLISRSLHAKYFPDQANCRNTVNGIMKKKNSEGAEYLSFLCYDAQHQQQVEFFTDEMAKLDWLEQRQFSVVPTEICHSQDAVIALYRNIQSQRASLAFDIDGLVIKSRKIDVADVQRARPERQVAFKFPAEEAVSTVKDIIWNEQGHRYTPIASVEPVSLAGTRVQRASLFNPQYIGNHGIAVGARVIVTKRGDIIPRIERRLALPDYSYLPLFPLYCPCCGTQIVNEKTRVYCPNPECIRRSYHRIRKWIEVLKIRTLGPRRLDRLIAAGMLRSIEDLYCLSAQKMSQIENFADKNIQNILNELQEHSHISFAQLLAGFDIAGVGEITTRKISQAGLDSLETLEKADSAQLESISGVGNSTAAALIEDFRQLLPEMQRLIAKGHIHLVSAPPDLLLTGESFCFTGGLSRMTRKEAAALVQRYGGEVRSSITRDLSYLVSNQADSIKSKKARELQIPTISEEEFYALFPVSGLHSQRGK